MLILEGIQKGKKDIIIIKCLKKQAESKLGKKAIVWSLEHSRDSGVFQFFLAVTSEKKRCPVGRYLSKEGEVGGGPGGAGGVGKEGSERQSRETKTREVGEEEGEKKRKETEGEKRDGNRKVSVI